MKDTLIDFQLFLLSRMRATNKVERALDQLGVGLQEMQHRSDKLAVVLLDAHPWKLYDELLGPPVYRASTHEGRSSHYFALPLWPEYWLEVPLDPSGLAQPMRFVRKIGAAAPARRHLIELLPWSCTRDEVLAMHPNLCLAEAWAWWEEYKIVNEQRPVVLFNWGLLQEVER